MNQQKITKAVIAAAGFGTRFLPQTKAMPKEMLPLINKPIIQHIVEELAESGIKDVIIVTGYHKRAVEDHFDYISADLRASLKQAGKNELLEETRKISDLANFVYIRQKGPYGTGSPLLNAAHMIGNEPFIYTYADDFVMANPVRFRQLLKVHASQGGSVLTCVRRERDEDFSRYGYIGGQEIEPGLVELNQIVEKPGQRELAPSALASVSGYVLEPAIFTYLERQLAAHSAEREFQVQDAMQAMIDDGHKFYGLEIKNGRHYDTGNNLDYLKTVVSIALQNPEIKDNFQDFLAGLIN